MNKYLSQLQRRTSLGWLQLRHDKMRLLVAIAGISFADILIFLQLGFMNALYETAVVLHRKLRTDIVLVNTQARQLTNLSTFPRRRLYQAQTVPGVESTDAMYINFIDWKNPTTRRKTSMLVVGIDPAQPMLDLPEVNQNLDRIKIPDTVLFDRGSRGDYKAVIAQVEQGKLAQTEIERRTITINGLFKVGASFSTDGVLMTSDQNYLRTFPKQNAGAVSLGLIRVQSGHDPEQVAASLNTYLAQFSDVRVLTKEGFVKFEQDYMTKNQPISFVFILGTTMGFIVGIVIVYQILSTDVNDHMAEYATFKAMGYRSRYLLGVILEESLILSVIGFVPGLAISTGLYVVVRAATALPMVMPLSRVLFVFLLTIVMCVASGAIATRKLQAADPADMF